MPLTVECPSCGKKLKAGERLAGLTRPCPACGQPLRIPDPSEDAEAAAYGLLSQIGEEAPAAADEPEPTQPPPSKPEPREPHGRRPLVIPKPPSRISTSLPLAANETTRVLRHLHWALALAMIPLAVSLLHKDANRDDILERLFQTMDEAPPDVQARMEQKLAEIEAGKASEEDLFRLLPGGKLKGAFLPRRTVIHWLFALAAIVIYMTFFMLLASDGSAVPVHLLLVGLATATVGVLLLLLIQFIAAATEGVVMVGGGIGAIIFWIFKVIGYSYRAALDPETSFVTSFLGFTVGVGFLEETTKLLPVVARFWRPNNFTWRNAFLWGMASGAGFGISEAVIYSGDFYNGISGPWIYPVRFISCVTLHAIWTGSAAIMLHQKQHLLHRDMAWYEVIVPILVYIGVPMVLHGLYDTLLKKEINAGALVVAALSFGFLAVQIYRLHGVDDVAATEKMLREYGRQRRSRA
jgi:RsiW-degrading membrane proteinase PrsW (M82 family)